MCVRSFLLVLVVGACDSGPLCEIVPSTSGPATGIHVQLRGPDRGARPVFVQDAAGTVVLDGVTADDGTFEVPEIPAGGLVTADIVDDQVTVHLVSYLGLRSGETVVVGSGVDTPTGNSTVTVRFPQLDGPSTLIYTVDVGSNCAAPIVNITQNTSQVGLVREFPVPVTCAAPGFATVLAFDTSSNTSVAVAGGAFDTTGGLDATSDVGSWSTETATLHIAAHSLSQAGVFSYRSETQRESAVASTPAAGTDIPFSASKVFDRIEVAASADKGGYFLRPSVITDLTISDDDFPAHTPDVDGSTTDHAGYQVSWRYDDPYSVAIASYLIDVDHFKVERQVITRSSECSVSVPSLPASYRIPTLTDPIGIGASEYVGIQFVYGAGLSEGDLLHHPITNDAPIDIPIVTTGASQLIGSDPGPPDPS